MLSINYQLLLTQIQALGQTLGFSQIAVAPLDLSSAEPHLQHWLSQNFHGSMDYMARHGMKRARPAELVPGTLSVLTARMNYLPRDTAEGWQDLEWQRLRNPAEAVVSVYARGRDYHKVLRNRLDTLAQQIDALLADALKPNGFEYRAFTDSAPVLEAELATRSGQGWRGGRALQQLGHHKVPAQNVGQAHPGLELFASHDLPRQPVHVVANDHGPLEKRRLQGGCAAGNQRHVAGGQHLVRLPRRHPHAARQACGLHMLLNHRFQAGHGGQHQLQVGVGLEQQGGGL
jgi:hypothetical protein